MVDGNSNAFPLDTPYVSHNGLTKREYFAALAMQAYLPSYKGSQTEHIAAWSVQAADSLIKKLNENEINSIK